MASRGPQTRGEVAQSNIIGYSLREDNVAVAARLESMSPLSNTVVSAPQAAAAAAAANLRSSRRGPKVELYCLPDIGEEEEEEEDEDEAREAEEEKEERASLAVRRAEEKEEAAVEAGEAALMAQLGEDSEDEEALVPKRRPNAAEKMAIGQKAHSDGTDYTTMKDQPAFHHLTFTSPDLSKWKRMVMNGKPFHDSSGQPHQFDLPTTI